MVPCRVLKFRPLYRWNWNEVLDIWSALRGSRLLECIRGNGIMGTVQTMTIVTARRFPSITRCGFSRCCLGRLYCTAHGSGLDSLAINNLGVHQRWINCCVAMLVNSNTTFCSFPFFVCLSTSDSERAMDLSRSCLLIVSAHHDDTLKTQRLDQLSP